MDSTQRIATLTDYRCHLIKSIDDSGETSLGRGKEGLFRLHMILGFKGYLITHLLSSSSPAAKGLILFETLRRTLTVIGLERCFSYYQVTHTCLLRINVGRKHFFAPTWSSRGGQLCRTGLHCRLQWSNCWKVSGSTWHVQDKTPAALNKCEQQYPSKWSSEKSDVIISIVHTY